MGSGTANFQPPSSSSGSTTLIETTSSSFLSARKIMVRWHQGPGARDVQMIAPGFGGKCRAAIGGDEGAERGSQPGRKRRPCDRSASSSVHLPWISTPMPHDRHSSVCQPEGLGSQNGYYTKPLRRRLRLLLVLALFDACRSAAIWSLLGEKRKRVACARNDVIDPVRTSQPSGDNRVELGNVGL